MSVFDKIKTGLEEAIAFEQGNGKGKAVRLAVEPVRQWNADEIKKIRVDAGMTQSLFAQVMGVSLKAVEAWESGRNTPAGPAGRMLFLMQQDPKLPERMNILHK